ncbi:hypothetical protein [Caenimonas sp. SL110]|uniref:hypothetical protein n=1 Tax=Caenimonas sp. SL110 TaxID=1450524 RepID=UPI00128BEFF0|nr:hypothetical protein [Caenimonas sp. SL110]
MQPIKKVLFEQSPPLWRHILLLWPMAVLPALAVGGLAHLIAHALGVGQAFGLGAHPGVSLASAFQSILFAPLVETLLLALLIEACAFFRLNKLLIAVIAGVIAGLLHAIASPIWFFTSAWAFFVYACAYLAWRPSSVPVAFTAAALVHALNNLVAAVLLLLVGYS